MAVFELFGDGSICIFTLPVAAGQKLEPGDVVGQSTAGFARPAGLLAATPTIVGRAVNYADNTSGVDGALSVKVMCRRDFLIANSTVALDRVEPAQAIGTTVFYDPTTKTAVDNDSTGTRAKLGVFYGLEEPIEGGVRPVRVFVDPGKV